VLYLKVDDTHARYVPGAREPAFRPHADRPGTMGYYEGTARTCSKARDLIEWARQAVGVAERTKS